MKEMSFSVKAVSSLKMIRKTRLTILLIILEMNLFRCLPGMLSQTDEVKHKDIWKTNIIIVSEKINYY
ncbi:hypothetical protein [Petroclostridium sp. X23]|uniref:hypothetical protein n=1 Tax=Petroclostridium sp. X23 TaxID=3045146 RepID=UPI0024ACC4D8|nr:hypothetical protein [Petroclostridium sp. X23]WHH60964.1 hypothetical protein QKW49_09765 [Petroclostridium sp. X23]